MSNFKIQRNVGLELINEYCRKFEKKKNII